MEAAIFPCPAWWRPYLPTGVLRAEREELAGRIWDLLALSRGAGIGAEMEHAPRCRILLAPGDGPPEAEAETVITYGLSPRDSLTLSSLAEPVLCVQRALPRPDGAVIEPQEFPLPPLPAPAEELLPLLGLKLLYMPLDGGGKVW